MKLQNFVTLKKGKKPKLLDEKHRINGVRFIQIEDLRSDNQLKFCELTADLVLVDSDCVLIAWDGANAGTVGFGLKGAIGSTIAALEFDFKKVYPPYLGTFLKSKFSYLRERATGATIPHLNRDSLLNLDIPIVDYQTQMVIAKRVAIATKLIKKRESAARELDSYLRSLFIETFGNLTKSTKWPRVKVEELVSPVPNSIRTGPFGSDLKHSEFVDSGVAVLGIDNVVTNEFRWDERRYITKEKYLHLKRYTVRPGDVLITIMGTVGRTCVVPENIPTSINTKHLVAITLDQQRATPEFLSKALLMHPEITAQLKRSEKGAIMAGLNLGIIKRLNFNLPPLELQFAFTEKVKQVQKLSEKLLKSKTEIESLFNSLLAESFQKGTHV